MTASEAARYAFLYGLGVLTLISAFMVIFTLVRIQTRPSQYGAPRLITPVALLTLLLLALLVLPFAANGFAHAYRSSPGQFAKEFNAARLRK